MYTEHLTPELSLSPSLGRDWWLSQLAGLKLCTKSTNPAYPGKLQCILHLLTKSLHQLTLQLILSLWLRYCTHVSILCFPPSFEMTSVTLNAPSATEWTSRPFQCLSRMSGFDLSTASLLGTSLIRYVLLECFDRGGSLLDAHWRPKGLAQPNVAFRRGQVGSISMLLEK